MWLDAAIGAFAVTTIRKAISAMAVAFDAALLAVYAYSWESEEIQTASERKVSQQLLEKSHGPLR